MENDREFLKNILRSFNDELESLVYRHKLQHLLMKHIKDLGIAEYLNPKIAVRMGSQLFYTQFIYGEYVASLSSLSTQLECEGIPYAVLKGFSFIHDLYTEDDVVYRGFGDADILIESAHVAKVTALLQREGFVQGRLRGNSIVPVDRRALLQKQLNSHQVQSFKRLTQYSSILPYFLINFDLNLTIFMGGKYEDPIKTSSLLDNTRKTSLTHSCEIRCLDYTLGLIQLCVHFYKDTIYSQKIRENEDYCLQKLCDIREYILQFHNNIDWRRLLDIVSSSGIEKEVFVPMYIVSSFYEDDCLRSIIDEQDFERPIFDIKKFL